MAAFEGKTVLVTGGGTGIGAATAVLVAAEGGNAIVLGPDREPVERVAGETGGASVVGDAADSEAIRRAVAIARERWGGLDALAACAGIGVTGTVGETDDETWRRTMHVNLDTAFVAARECLPALIERQGAIVVVSSVAGLRATPGLAAYVTSKHALLGLVKALAADYGHLGVRANAVCPGLVRTPLADGMIVDVAAKHGLSVDEVYARAASDTPLQRYAEPEDIAELICFLASDRARTITGASVVADAGACAIDPAAKTLAVADGRD